LFFIIATFLCCKKLEEKFHGCFFDGICELKLSNLKSVKQGHDDCILDYVADLSSFGLHSRIQENLEFVFLTIK
jgi:hypothetical protein